MIAKNLFIRNLDADGYYENFLVSAIVSVFVIRLFLAVTGYPIIGGGYYHIAHMLWGGLFMLVAFIILFSFLSQRAHVVSSLIGGIGFGAFIDEVGKYITSDNNYFFQPAIALIYIIFVFIFLITRFIPRYHEISQREYLVNAIEMLKESAIDDFDVEEQKRAEEYLRHCDQKNPTVIALTKLLAGLPVERVHRPSLFTKLRVQLRKVYYKAGESDRILNSIIVYLAATTAWTFVNSVLYFTRRAHLHFSDIGELYSSMLAGAFVLIGLFALRISRFEGYRYFRMSMLVTILLTEFFSLMHPDSIEILLLAANVFVLMIINYAMIRERKKVKKMRDLDKDE